MTYLGDASFARRILRSIVTTIGTPPKPDGPGRRPLVIGHRGAPRDAPENTLASFRRALDLGADAVETDVCATRDSRFVLWHDDDPGGAVALARQAGLEGPYLYEPALPLLGSDGRLPVGACDEAFFREHYGYVRSSEGLTNPLDGSRRPDVPPARLADLLDWAPGETRLTDVLLDVKIEPARPEEAVRLLRLVAERVRDAGRRKGPTYHFLTSQRELARTLAAEARKDPLPGGVVLTADFELPGILWGARRYGIRDVSMGAGRRTWPDFQDEVARVVRARNRGRVASVLAWTVNDADRLRDLAALGVDGIVTDDCALLRSISGGP